MKQTPPESQLRLRFLFLCKRLDSVPSSRFLAVGPLRRCRFPFPSLCQLLRCFIVQVEKEMQKRWRERREIEPGPDFPESGIVSNVGVAARCSSEPLLCPTRTGLLKHLFTC